MESRVAVYRSDRQSYLYADTCESLKIAATRGDLRIDARSRGAYPGPPLPDNVLPEVRSIGRWNANYDQNWGLEWHQNEGIELTLVTRGQVVFGLDGQRFCLQPGDLVVTRPWQRHYIGDPHVTASCLYWLILDVGVRRPNQRWMWPNWLLLSDGDLKQLTAMLRHNEQPVWHSNKQFQEYFEKIGDAFGNLDDGASESHLKLYINGLLIALMDLLLQKQPVLDVELSSARRTVSLFLEALKENAGEDWTLDSMAVACGLHRSRFAYYCKQLTNMSPVEYLTRCRIELASRILHDCNNLSITDVALESGFSSSQYFATVFRRHFGLPPSEYRRVRLVEAEL